MLRTEVVASKNIRKTLFFKIYNGLAIVLVIFILMMLLHVFGTGSAIGKFIQEHYNDVVRPAILIAAFVIFIASIVSRSAAKSPKRLGSIEIDESEIKYLVDDEIKESIPISEIRKIDFEYFSFRMRGNPMGCMNYLKIDTSKGEKKYEIVIANSLVKAELGDTLAKINQKVPVKVSYAYFLNKILKDRDFKF